MPIATTNPPPARYYKTFTALTDAEIDSRLQAAADGFRTLRADQLRRPGRLDAGRRRHPGRRAGRARRR